MRSPGLVLLLLACGAPPAEPLAPPEPVQAELSADARAHRDAELVDWLAVDAIIGRCYEPRAGEPPVSAGSVAVRFTVHPSGRAESIAIAHAEPHDAEAEACILSAVATMPFTPSAAPVERTIERRFDEP